MNYFKAVFWSILIGGFQGGFAQIQTLAELPKSVAESSGLAYDGNLLWTHNDSGNDEIIYGLNPNSGVVETKIYPEKVYNKDWEDMARGADGSLYIGDLGNNRFSRKHLTIYSLKVENDQAETQFETRIEFPSDYTTKKGKIKFDIEAFIYRDGHFYLFTKTFKNEFEKQTEVFQVLAQNGTQMAVYCGSISLCNNAGNCKITGAAFNEETGQLALISHKNLWLIDNFDPLQLEVVSSTRVKLNEESQKEGVAYKDAEHLYISEERNKGQQRLYLLDISEL